MRRILLFQLLLVLLVGCARGPVNNNQPAASASVEPPKITSTGVVKVSIEPVELKRGGSVDASVLLKIDKGYHINANPASDPYLRATELKLTAPEGITVNFLTYPNALTRTFPFSEKPLAVYESEALIKVQLAGSKTAPIGSQNLTGKLNVQACDEHVCYAPGIIDVTIPVNTK